MDLVLGISVVLLFGMLASWLQYRVSMRAIDRMESMEANHRSRLSQEVKQSQKYANMLMSITSTNAFIQYQQALAYNPNQYSEAEPQIAVNGTGAEPSFQDDVNSYQNLKSHMAEQALKARGFHEDALAGTPPYSDGMD